MLGAAPSVAQEASAPFSGLYLKAEGGYSWANSAKFTDRNASDCVICGSGRVNNNLGGSGSFGAGVGYRFNDWLRSDLTLTYRGGYRLNANQNGVNYRSNIKSWVGLVSAFVDVPVKLGPISPFIGAGIGFARNTVGGISQSYADYSDPNFPFTFTESDPGGTSTSFAWMGTAGLTWAIDRNWAIDLSFRYLDAGNLKTSAGSSTLTFDGASFSEPTGGIKGRLTSQDLLIGVRYAF